MTDDSRKCKRECDDGFVQLENECVIPGIKVTPLPPEAPVDGSIGNLCLTHGGVLWEYSWSITWVRAQSGVVHVFPYHNPPVGTPSTQTAIGLNKA